MMNYGYGYKDMMGGGDALAFIAWLAFTADLVLLGFYLWKQISKN